MEIAGGKRDQGKAERHEYQPHGEGQPVGRSEPGADRHEVAQKGPAHERAEEEERRHDRDVGMIVGIHGFAALFLRLPAKEAGLASSSSKLNTGAGQICLLRLKNWPLI